MALLIDKLRTGKFTVPFTDRTETVEIRRATAALLNHPGVIVVDGTNVAEWFYNGNDQEFWNYRTDFPNLAPPWRAFWIECRRPVTDGELPDRWGVMFSATRQDDGGWVLHATGYMQVGGLITGPLFDLIAEIDDEGKWVDHIETLGQVDVVKPTGDGGWLLEDGTLRTRWGIVVPTPADSDPESETIKSYIHAVNSLLLAPLMTISFAHCRNVEHTTVQPPKKLSKAHERRHGTPLVRHRVLQIGGQSRRVDAQAQSSGVGRIEALHIVKGHFKHYTEEAPLMGRHVGTYWWADHVRGDAAAGEVVKDYEVQP